MNRIKMKNVVCFAILLTMIIHTVVFAGTGDLEWGNTYDMSTDVVRFGADNENDQNPNVGYFTDPTNANNTVAGVRNDKDSGNRGTAYIDLPYIAKPVCVDIDFYRTVASGSLEFKLANNKSGKGVLYNECAPFFFDGGAMYVRESDGNGSYVHTNIGSYNQGKWYNVRIMINAAKTRYIVYTKAASDITYRYCGNHAFNKDFVFADGDEMTFIVQGNGTSVSYFDNAKFTILDEDFEKGVRYEFNDVTTITGKYWSSLNINTNASTGNITYEQAEFDGEKVLKSSMNASTDVEAYTWEDVLDMDKVVIRTRMGYDADGDEEANLPYQFGIRPIFAQADGTKGPDARKNLAQGIRLERSGYWNIEAWNPSRTAGGDQDGDGMIDTTLGYRIEDGKLYEAGYVYDRVNKLFKAYVITNKGETLVRDASSDAYVQEQRYLAGVSLYTRSRVKTGEYAFLTGKGYYDYLYVDEAEDFVPTKTVPKNGADGVDSDGVIKVDFNYVIDPENVGTAAIKANDGTNIGASITTTNGRTLIITPDSSLTEGKSYTLTLTGTKDLMGQTTKDVVVSFSTKQYNIMYEQNLTSLADYAVFECDLYYEKGQIAVNEISFEGVGGEGVLFEMSDSELTLGKSVTPVTAQNGWYNVKAEMDYNRENAIITVTMPDGGVIQRADPRYLNGTTALSKIIGVSGEDGLKNAKLSTEYADTPKDAVRVEITDITVSGSDVRGFSQLNSGDRVSIITEYTSLSGADETFSVFAAYYGGDKKLKMVQPIATQTVTDGKKDGNFTHSFDVLDVEDAEEIRFFVWDSFVGMKPFYKSVSVAETTFSDEQVYNIVTTFAEDAKSTRGFAWTAIPEYTDMVIRYAPYGSDIDAVGITKQADYSEYEGRLYYTTDIEGLTPNTTYIYKIGDVQDGLWSEEYNFTTEAEGTDSFTFIGYSDPQSSVWNGGFEYLEDVLDVAMLEAPQAAFMVNLGDAVESGQEPVANGTVENQWFEYFRAANGYSQSLPHMTTIGNHETRGDAQTSGKHYALHFNNPDNGANALGDMTADDVTHDCAKGIISNIDDSVYSFDYGNTHFAVLNSGTDWSQTDSIAILKKQAEWLESDMTASDKKWKILLMHISAYPARTQRFGTADALQAVIDKCGIDLVLQGHDHIVMRTYPMKNNAVVTKQSTNVIEKGTGTVYTILGSAGAKRYEVVTDTPEYATVLNTTATTQPSYSVFNVGDDYIEVTTKQINGMLIDKFRINDKSE